LRTRLERGVLLRDLDRFVLRDLLIVGSTGACDDEREGENEREQKELAERVVPEPTSPL